MVIWSYFNCGFNIFYCQWTIEEHVLYVCKRRRFYTFYFRKLWLNIIIDKKEEEKFMIYFLPCFFTFSFTTKV